MQFEMPISPPSFWKPPGGTLASNVQTTPPKPLLNRSLGEMAWETQLSNGWKTLIFDGAYMECFIGILWNRMLER